MGKLEIRDGKRHELINKHVVSPFFFICISHREVFLLASRWGEITFSFFSLRFLATAGNRFSHTLGRGKWKRKWGNSDASPDGCVTRRRGKGTGEFRADSEFSGKLEDVDVANFAPNLTCWLTANLPFFGQDVHSLSRKASIRTKLVLVFFF